MRKFTAIRETENSNLIVKELNAAVLSATFPTTTGTYGANVYSSANSANQIVRLGTCAPVNSKYEETILIEFSSEGITEQVLEYINKKTHRLNLEEKTTKEVAEKFNLATSAAYRVLSILENKALITKLDPVNGNHFDCCGWIRNEDPE